MLNFFEGADMPVMTKGSEEPLLLQEARDLSRHGGFGMIGGILDGCGYGAHDAFHLCLDLWEFLNRQNIAIAQDDGPEDRILQLADIARPIVGRQNLKRP